MDLDLLVPLAGMATSVVLFLPIVRAIVRVAEKKLAGSHDADELEALRDEIHVVQQQIERFESDESRLAELEERLDFAERMLAQQRDVRRVEGGG